MQAPWLVQRMKFEDRGGKSFDGVLRLDYMGSAEYEFGAVPKSLKRITSRADMLEIIHVAGFHDYMNQKLYAISSLEKAEQYLQYFGQLVQETMPLKQRSEMKESSTGIDFMGKHIEDYRKSDAWWDLDNDIMWCYGKSNAKKIKDAVIATRDKKKKAGDEGWF